MSARSFRRLTSIVIIYLFCFSFAGTLAAQQPKPEPTTTQSQAQDQPVAPPLSKKASTKPLAVDEDPAMIGKRNLNKGLISKMSMSYEKEVRLGRMLAAEVDRQAKFIDDPVITEYVNRVAQNLVLHSDAKVPFTVKVIDSDKQRIDSRRRQ